MGRGALASLVAAVGWSLSVMSAAVAAVPCVDGGPFHPLSSLTCDLSLKPDGVYNFTTITIPAGVAVAFTQNAANTPVTLNATGGVSIMGTIDVSGSQFDLGSRIGGPGGNSGGLLGSGVASGTAGSGLSPGQGGIAPKHAGGGGGMATAGTIAFRFTDPGAGAAGGPVPFPSPLTGGSGGGGGAGLLFFGVPLGGGDGGGGGGAIRISTSGTITVGGRILANGSPGGVGYGIGPGGPGGGGSGGVIDLAAAAITLEATALLQARGGRGGGISTLPVYHPDFDSGAHGGLGFARFAASDLTIAGTVEAFPVVGSGSPHPVNPFLCYKIKPPKSDAFEPPATPVVLTDQFQGATFDVDKSLSLCTPASKRNEGLVDPATHLKGYQIKLTSTRPAQPRHVPRVGLGVANQFGTVIVDTVKPERLLVPAAKDHGAFPAAPEADTHHVDHYTCYSVRLSRGAPKFAPVLGIPIVDQFDQPKLFDLKRPTRLCTATDKNAEVRENADLHLLCYAAAPARGEPKHVAVQGLYVADQFGQQRLDALQVEELCVPSFTLTP